MTRLTPAGCKAKIKGSTNYTVPGLRYHSSAGRGSFFGGHACPPILGHRANPISREIHDLSNSHAARERTSLQDRLEIADFVAYRRGRLAFSGWTISRAAFRELLQTGRPVVAGDLRPAVTQKGVDMKIGLDVAWLATRHIVDTIVLISGDTDFVPAMKLARREGVHVAVATASGNCSTHLLAHSDEHRTICI